ncbi:NAD(P)-binding protein [Polychaeton citri CBS 116435]|uniref:NAD(P)-binding protein n=1 Tax=Polychaeton citri CBS 116435 TaxID=1314669 RepID=A0A9P4UV59_9PEZI|nr:NAD(P)-binding protein [Polychaeton citri CBS 116435]
MPTAVITGANSGIGHALARHLISLSYEVHAADVTIGEPLQALTGCRLHRLDVRSPENITAFAATLTDRPVHVLLNVAGVMAPAPLDALDEITPEILAQTFQVNAFGPLLLTQALLPNLLAAAAGSEDGARVGIVSSRVGSIGDNTTGGSYAYRASKAAVNAFGKNLAIDLAPKGIVVSLLHPGFVKTNLNPGEVPPEAVEPEEAAVKLWDVMIAKGVADTGKFWHREGMELPW